MYHDLVDRQSEGYNIRSVHDKVSSKSQFTRINALLMMTLFTKQNRTYETQSDALHADVFCRMTTAAKVFSNWKIRHLRGNNDRSPLG